MVLAFTGTYESEKLDRERAAPWPNPSAQQEHLRAASYGRRRRASVNPSDFEEFRDDRNGRNRRSTDRSTWISKFSRACSIKISLRPVRSFKQGAAIYISVPPLQATPCVPARRSRGCFSATSAFVSLQSFHRWRSGRVRVGPYLKVIRD